MSIVFDIDYQRIEKNDGVKCAEGTSTSFIKKILNRVCHAANQLGRGIRSVNFLKRFRDVSSCHTT